MRDVPREAWPCRNAIARVAIIVDQISKQRIGLSEDISHDLLLAVWHRFLFGFVKLFVSLFRWAKLFCIKWDIGVIVMLDRFCMQQLLPAHLQQNLQAEEGTGIT